MSTLKFYALATLAGLLFLSAFSSEYLWWAFLPAFVVMLYVTNIESSYKKLFFGHWYIGTILAFGGVSWFWTTYPVSSLSGTPPSLQLLLIALYSLFVAGSMGLGTACYGLVAKCLMQKKWWLLIPFVWVLSEPLKSIFFSIHTYGAGGSVNANFSFSYVGYLLANEHVLFMSIASVLGVYGLSFVAAATGVLFYVIIFEEKRTVRLYACFAYICLILMLFFASMYYFQKEPQQIGKSVYVIDTTFDSYFLERENSSFESAMQIKDAVEVALQHNPDYIVLPEDAGLQSIFENKDKMFAWMGDNDTVLINSTTMYDEREELVLRAQIFDTHTQNLSLMDKQYLVPQGEFMPLFYSTILSLVLSDDSYEEISNHYAYRPGLELEDPLLPDYIPGILFCFESANPLGVRKAIETRHPAFVAHVVSHAWFHSPKTLWYQLDNMLQVHAMWQQVPIVSATNMAQSKLYKPNGTIEQGTVVEHSKYWRVVMYSL